MAESNFTKILSHKRDKRVFGEYLMENPRAKRSELKALLKTLQYDNETLNNYFVEVTNRVSKLSSVDRRMVVFVVNSDDASKDGI